MDEPRTLRCVIHLDVIPTLNVPRSSSNQSDSAIESRNLLGLYSGHKYYYKRFVIPNTATSATGRVDGWPRVSRRSGIR